MARPTRDCPRCAKTMSFAVHIPRIGYPGESDWFFTCDSCGHVASERHEEHTDQKVQDPKWSPIE